MLKVCYYFCIVIEKKKKIWNNFLVYRIPKIAGIKIKFAQALKRSGQNYERGKRLKVSFWGSSIIPIALEGKFHSKENIKQDK